MQLPSLKTSYWIKSTESPGYPPPTGDVSVDVVIIGAGITGLTAAYLLKRAGLKVAVIDKGSVGGGGSGHTTGKVTSQHNLIYAQLMHRLGETNARNYAQANQAAIDQIRKHIAQERIACDWERDDNYVFTTDPSQVGQFKDEAKAAQKLGLPATFEAGTPLPFEVQAAVKFTGQGKFHTRKYLLGLAKAVHGQGSFMYENTVAFGIRDGSPARVKVKGASIYAKDIIVATNVPTFPLMARGGYCAMEYPAKSYIVAAPIKVPLKGMYISPDKNHYSILPITDGNKHLLLIGGESHIPGTRFNIDGRYQKLADYASQRFKVSSIDYRWEARDYLSYDDMPLVGKLYPWSKHVYTATAFMKWGLTNGTVAGMILSDLITGQANPWAKTFDSLRLSPVTSIPKVIREKIQG